MSESTFPFAPDAESDAPDDDGARRRTVLGLGALTAAALAAGAVLLLGGSDVDDALATGQPPAEAVATGAQPSASSSASPDTTATAEAAAVAVARGRNPFEVRLGAAVPGEAPPAGSVPVPVVEPAPQSGAAPPADEGRTSTDGALPSTSAQDPRQAGTGTTQTDRRIALVRVGGSAEKRSAVLLLDGQEHVAAVGDSVGPAGELLLLSLQQGPDDGQWTAVLQVGQGDPFDVVTGTPVAVP